MEPEMTPEAVQYEQRIDEIVDELAKSKEELASVKRALEIANYKLMAVAMILNSKAG